jgi:hypothetical protein
MFNPLVMLHHLLPLRFKFLPESYVLKEGKDVKALITVAPTKSWQKKIEIQKLFFEENSLDVAADLVQYVVSKYKAMGATSVIVKVDDFLTELLQMFVSKCGFSQISQEKLCAELQRRGVDIGRSTYEKYEVGELNIRASVIVELKKFYNCTYDEFFVGLE